MDKFSFVKYLNSEKDISLIEKDEILKLAEEFPWSASIQMLYSKYLLQTKSAFADKQIKRTSVLVSDRKSYYWFLEKTYQKEIIKEEAFKSKKGLLKKEEKLQYSSYNISVDVPKAKKIDKKRQKSNIDELIDQFINDPNCIRSKDKHKLVDNEDYAAKSSHLDNDLITETLALLYEKKGLYDKAIETYNKLNLIFPEKNIYFANRIEELKNLKINNQE